MSRDAFEVGPFLDPGGTWTGGTFSYKPMDFTGERGRGTWGFYLQYINGAGYTFRILGTLIDPEGRRTSIDFDGHYSGSDLRSALLPEIQRRAAPLLAAWDADIEGRRERRIALLTRRISEAEHQIQKWREELESA